MASTVMGKFVYFWSCLFLVSGIPKETERSVVGGGAYVLPLPSFPLHHVLPLGLQSRWVGKVCTVGLGSGWTLVPEKGHSWPGR